MKYVNQCGAFQAVLGGTHHDMPYEKKEDKRWREGGKWERKKGGRIKGKKQDKRKKESKRKIWGCVFYVQITL